MYAKANAQARAAKSSALILLGGMTIATAMLVGPVRAQIHPDAKSGRAIAEKLCTNCHIVGTEAATAIVKADVPSFADIANKPGQTTETIAGRIVVPHPPMPTIQLTREEIGDVAAYIMTLKSDAR